jgi:hypothetical protein
MPSKPLTYVVFVVACFASAAGGAYFALRQPERPPAPVAATPADRVPAAEPQPVVPLGAATTTQRSSALSSARTDAPARLEETAPRPAVLEARVQAPPVPSATRPAEPRKQAKKVLPPEKPSNDQPGVSTPQPRLTEGSPQAPSAAEPPMSQSQAVDPGPQAQRPWPGPPVSPAPSQQPPQTSGAVGEPVRPEQEAPADERSRQWLEIVIPSESVLGLELESTINTEFARVEDEVDARVTRDVRVDGRVAIPAGTQAIGSVTVVERGGPVKTRARLGFRFHTLVFADKSRVSIVTDTVYRVGESPGNQSSAKIGGAAIGGAIIGAILGGGKGAAIGSGIGAAGGAAAAMRGDRLPVVVPAGTTLSVRTQASFSLNVEK